MIPSHEFVEKYMDQLYFYYESMKNIAKRMEQAGMQPPLTLLRSHQMDSYLASALSPPIPPPPPSPAMRTFETYLPPPPPPPSSQPMSTALTKPPTKTMNKRGRKKRPKIDDTNSTVVESDTIAWDTKMIKTETKDGVPTRSNETVLTNGDDKKRTETSLMDAIAE